MDESGFTRVEKIPKIIAPKGIKQVGQITGRERGGLVTVCAIASAGGVTLPPVFIFPLKEFQSYMMNNAPEGSLWLVSDNGWMTTEKFLCVLEHFVKYVHSSRDYPAILVMDNHEIHIYLHALMYAREYHIHVITLVPHISNKTQPFD